jgi:hypothetical protein
MANRDDSFVLRLVEEFPHLAPALDEHLVDNFGELLPYLFMGEVAQRVAVERQDTAMEAEAGRLLDFLEREFATSEGSSIRDLILAGFVESLPYPGEPCDDVRDALGPLLGHEWDRQVGGA